MGPRRHRRGETEDLGCFALGRVAAMGPRRHRRGDVTITPLDKTNEDSPQWATASPPWRVSAPIRPPGKKHRRNGATASCHRRGDLNTGSTFTPGNKPQWGHGVTAVETGTGPFREAQDAKPQW